jgi:hypothetical protein
MLGPLPCQKAVEPGPYLARVGDGSININRALRLWVTDGRGQQADATAGLPPAPEISVRSGTYAPCYNLTSYGA